MKTTYSHILVCFALILFTLVSCTKTQQDEACVSFFNAPVTKVAGPATASLNQPINLTISFGCISGCGQFGNFDQSSNSNTTTIKVIAKYQGCICTQDAPVRETAYTFSASEAGIYNLKFLQSGNGYLTHTITVQ